MSSSDDSSNSFKGPNPDRIEEEKKFKSGL